MKTLTIPEHKIELYRYDELSEDVKKDCKEEWTSKNLGSEVQILQTETSFIETPFSDGDEEEIEEMFSDYIKNTWFSSKGIEYIDYKTYLSRQ